MKFKMNYEKKLYYITDKQYTIMIYYYLSITDLLLKNHTIYGNIKLFNWPMICCDIIAIT
jgi:hypothetical protein